MLARQAASLKRAPDPNEQIMAQPGRALFRIAHRKIDQARWVGEHRGTRNPKVQSTPSSISTMLATRHSDEPSPAMTSWPPPNAPAPTTLSRHDMMDLWFGTLVSFSSKEMVTGGYANVLSRFYLWGGAIASGSIMLLRHAALISKQSPLPDCRAERLNLICV